MLSSCDLPIHDPHLAPGGALPVSQSCVLVGWLCVCSSPCALAHEILRAGTVSDLSHLSPAGPALALLSLCLAE